MRVSRPILAAALVAAALLLGFAAWIGRDPFVLVRAEVARQRMAAGLSRETIEVSDHRWVYAVEEGPAPDAPVLVMLHGFTGSKENWYPLAEALDGRYRLFIPDLPGWGDSQRRDGADYGYAAQAGRVAAFIRAVSLRRRVVLLGHSMGGGIAALVAARHPQRVAKVGLLDAAGVRFRENRFGLGVLAGENPFAVDDEASLQRYLDTVFHDPAAKPWLPWPASKGLIERRRRDAAFEQRVLDRIGRGDESLLPGEAARAVRQPALLLWCRQDAVIDASAMAIYAERIPQATTVLLDGCGHMSLMERPAAVAAAVAALVEAAPTPP